jgi:hypothetical protein
MKNLLFFICILFLLSAHNCFAGHILIVDKVGVNVINGNSPASDSSLPSEDPNFNTVLVSTGIISIVNGAQWCNGDVSNNKILLNSGGNVMTVCGGYIVYTGNAYNNEVIINDGAIAGTFSDDPENVFGVVYGARVSTGNAHNNTVVIENHGTVNFNIQASMVDYGNAIDNTVTVNSGGAVKGTIYGGMSKKNGHANTNTVIINAGATVSNGVYGGHATHGNANNNSVTIEASNIGDYVNGGFVRNLGDSIGNTVNIRTGTIGVDVYGGGATHGNANNNSVTIEASNIGNHVHGGWSNDGNTNDNIVNIRSMSKISHNVYGGWARGNGNANGNLVNLENCNISSDVFCGRVGGSNGGDSNNNTVNIYGTTNARKVYAAYIHNNGNARNNIINIYGTANTDILCAWVDGNGLATDNKVIIHETGKLGKEDFIIFGAKTQGGTNNTLEIHSKDNIAYGVYGFQNYIFFLPSDIKSGDTMFTALNGNGQSKWDRPDIYDTRIDLTSIVKIDIEMSPYTKLKQGDSITILCSNDGFNNDLNTDIREIEGQGQTLALNVKHKFTLYKEAHELKAKLESKKIEFRPEVKSFSKGNIGELVFLNFGSDLIANNGIQEASKVLGLKAFGAFAAGQSKYNIGGTINLNNISSLFGIAKNFKITGASAHIITAGIFCEYGNGNYKIKDIISTGEVRSNGDISYIGAGLLGKLDIGKIEGLYCQGSVRAGKSKNIFNSADIRDTFQNKKASYDYDVPYYSCHIGCGYTYKLTENINLEGYSKYIFTHQNEKKAILHTSEEINFKGLNSSRIGVGVKCKYEGKKDKKLTQKHTKWTTNFYTGIMHEQEFQGNINATIQDSYQLEEINLSGPTEVGELGVQINVGRINIDVSGEVFVGKREGISGNVKIKCAIP